jgi:hypothetical protein
VCSRQEADAAQMTWTARYIIHLTLGTSANKSVLQHDCCGGTDQHQSSCDTTTLQLGCPLLWTRTPTQFLSYSVKDSKLTFLYITSPCTELRSSTTPACVLADLIVSRRFRPGHQQLQLVTVIRVMIVLILATSWRFEPRYVVCGLCGAETCIRNGITAPRNSSQSRVLRFAVRL